MTARKVLFAWDAAIAFSVKDLSKSTLCCISLSFHMHPELYMMMELTAYTNRMRGNCSTGITDPGIMSRYSMASRTRRKKM